MILTIALCGFVIAGAASAWRVFVGPTLADRVLALDVAFMAVMGGIATHVADGGPRSLLGILPAIAIVGFTSTIAVTRFMEDEEVP